MPATAEIVARSYSAMPLAEITSTEHSIQRLVCVMHCQRRASSVRICLRHRLSHSGRAGFAAPGLSHPVCLEAPPEPIVPMRFDCPRAVSDGEQGKTINQFMSALVTNYL